MNGNGHERLRILAVDDDLLMLDLYQNALSVMGRPYRSEYDFDLTLCEQGNEALHVATKANDTGEPFAVF